MLNGKKVLVTGGSGFLGSNLIPALLARGAKITNVSKGAGQDKETPNLRTLDIDLTSSDFSFLDEGFDYVIHLAALSNPRLCADREEAIRNNVDLTKVFFQKLLDAKVKKVLFPSTITLYSNNAKSPVSEDAELDISQNNYTYTKGLDEQLCLEFQKKGLPITVLRLANVYGPYQAYKPFPNLIPQLIYQALVENKLVVWNESPIRDWLYVSDVVNAMLSALEASFTGVLNIGTGKGASVGEIVALVKSATGAAVHFEGKPVTGPTNMICDISRAKQALNWCPRTNIKDGLTKTIAYYQEEFKRQKLL